MVHHFHFGSHDELFLAKADITVYIAKQDCEDLVSRPTGAGVECFEDHLDSANDHN